MALKLLTRKDNTLSSEEMGVRLKLGRLLPEHISEMQGIMCKSKKPSDAVAIYALRECVSELNVAGEDYEPRKLSYQINPSDKDNAATLTVIAAIIIEEVLVSDDMRKKLQKQRETSSQEAMPNAANPAPTTASA